MPTYTKITTSNPYDSNFSFTLSGTATGTFTQTLVTVPAGKVLVISQISAGANTTINHLDGPSSFLVQLAIVASTFTNFAGLELGPGAYTLNTSLAGAYTWTVTGRYETLNS